MPTRDPQRRLPAIAAPETGVAGMALKATRKTSKFRGKIAARLCLCLRLHQRDKRKRRALHS